jgi:predicted transcriptional regulator
MNIIERRLTKSLALQYKTSIDEQNRKQPRRRRASYKKGVAALPHSIKFRAGDRLKEDLDALCEDVGIERGIVIREALEFYIGMARQEGIGAGSCPTTEGKKNA